MDAVKRCTVCRSVKPVDAFYRESRSTDGLQASCKLCHLQRVRAYRERLRTINTLRQPDLEGPKICGSCGREKAGRDFHRNRSTRDGLHSACKDCNSAGRPTARRAEQRRRFRTYEITPEEVTALLEQQDGVCAICRLPFNDATFHVDHCHVTGTVRGLLCGRCNTGLGLLGDDAGRLRTAANYLEHPPIEAIRPP